MIYLSSFKLLSDDMEKAIITRKLNIYNNIYPFNIFSEKEFKDIHFEPITCFYGGNGSGKTTLLNIISTTLSSSRRSVGNNGSLFQTYCEHCDYNLENEFDLVEKKYISSDDIFDYLLDLRAVNNGVDRRKRDLMEEYDNAKYGNKTFNPLQEYETLKNSVDAKRMTKSKYIRSHLTNNTIVLQSNGESALEFWEQEIKENAIYFLDEPENSLSAENQLKLAKFIEESARFYNCQFIISTHSPFILSIKDALVYDLDQVPVETRRWSELKNIKIYYDFFKENKGAFESEE